MNHPILHIFFRTAIRRFYARNAGFFVLVFVVMVGIIDTLQEDDVMALFYQYRLLVGMLASWTTCVLVALLWSLYAIKCCRFIIGMLASPAYQFLRELNSLPTKKNIVYFILVHCSLQVPVWIYAVTAVIIAHTHHQFDKALFIVVSQLATGACSVAWYLYSLRRIGEPPGFLLVPRRMAAAAKPYFFMLLSQVAHRMAYMYFGLQLFLLIIGYAFLHNPAMEHADLRLLFLVTTIVLAGFTSIIHKIREMEESRMLFYRQLPVFLINRWIQYLAFYCLLLLPEVVAVLCIIPAHIPWSAGIALLAYSLSYLMLLHSIHSAAWLSVKRALKIALAIFMVQYILIIGHFTWELVAIQSLSALLLFAVTFYRYDAHHADNA